MRRRTWKKTLLFYEKRINYKARKLNKLIPIQDYLLELIENKKQVKIADVGCGPFSLVGTKHNSINVQVTASDYLANEYNQMINNAKIKPIIPIEKQDMEKMTYPDESFDIVHCVNALDHTANAIKALNEIERICKKGGWIYLRHFEDVGDRRHYSGLHSWNINRYGILWNKNKRVYLMDYDIDYKDSMVICKMKKK